MSTDQTTARDRAIEDDDLRKTIALMRMSESVTLTGPALANVLRALAGAPDVTAIEKLAAELEQQAADTTPDPGWSEQGLSVEDACEKYYDAGVADALEDAASRLRRLLGVTTNEPEEGTR